MRRGNGLASAMPASIVSAARVNAACKPNTLDTTPQNAEPKANAPSAESACSAAARERTHGGALVCVAVLKVDITLIHAAPPATSARYTSACMRVQAAIAIAAAKIR